MVYASDFTGTNPFGGLCLNKDLIGNFEEFRENLIGELGLLKYNGTPVFNWIKCREDLFSGKFVERFPEVLFEMNSSLGINWALHTDLFTINPTHKKISGGHKENGVLLSNNLTKDRIDLSGLEMKNLFPTVLDFFGIAYHDKCNGSSFLRLSK